MKRKTLVCLVPRGTASASTHQTKSLDPWCGLALHMELLMDHPHFCAPPLRSWCGCGYNPPTLGPCPGAALGRVFCLPHP